MTPRDEDKPAGSSRAHHALAVLFLSGAVCWLFGALATDQRLRTHEGHWLYERTAAYLSEIRAGQVPPQVFPETVAGGGSAFPFFYPPAAYLIASAASALAGGVERGVHASFALSAWLSAVFFYVVAHRLCRSSSIAVLGAVLYLVATYRFVDIFARGALAECWTFVWYPPIALGVVRMLQGRGMRWYLPVSLGMLLLTHTVMTLYTVALAAPVLLVRARRTWAAGMVTLGLAFGLAAWYVVPMKLGLADVWAGTPGFLASPRNVAYHTPTFAQLFKSSPEHWYGDSKPGDRDGMSFALGFADLALLPLAAACLAWALRRRDQAASPTAGLAAPLGATALWGLAVLFILLPGAFLRFAPREFLLVQFSWRLLGHTTFLSAFAVALWLGWLRERRAGGVAGRLAPVVLVAVAFASLAAVPAHHRAARTFAPEERPAGSKATMTGFTVLGEYLPRELSPDHADYKVRRLAKAIESAAPAIRLERTGSTSRVHVRIERAGDLTLPLLYYNFYAARTANGTAVPIRRDEGLARLRLREGSYTVEMKPRTTLPRWIGFALSAAAVAGIAISARRRGRRGAYAPGAE